jgi:hypothetical protein
MAAADRVKLDSIAGNATNTPFSTAALTFSGSWVNFGSGFSTAKASKLGRFVSVEGLIKSGAASGAMAILPVGYRPTEQLIFLCQCSGGQQRIDVQPDGQIVFGGEGTGTPSTYLSLAGINFPVA